MSAQAWAHELELQHRYYEEIVMPKVSDMIQSKFLRKEDFEEDRVMTIKSVKLEDMPGDSGDQKWVLYFREDAKGMALNVTSIRVLESAFGDDSDMWVGKRVMVYVDPNVSFGGRVVGGLRLRAPKAQKKVEPEPTAEADFDDDIPFKGAASTRVNKGHIHSPAGDAMINGDSRKASMYVTEFIKSSATRDDAGAKQLWDELKADHDTTIMVWKNMKRQHPTEFNYLKQLVTP